MMVQQRQMATLQRSLVGGLVDVSSKHIHLAEDLNLLLTAACHLFKVFF